MVWDLHHLSAVQTAWDLDLSAVHTDIKEQQVTCKEITAITAIMLGLGLGALPGKGDLLSECMHGRGYYVYV